jgi:hypothetical protein
MTALPKPSRDEFKTAQHHLKVNGWEHVASLMIDDAQTTDTTEFGSQWKRAGETFWLNYKTIDMLPGKGKPADVTPILPFSATLEPQTGDATMPATKTAPKTAKKTAPKSAAAKTAAAIARLTDNPDVQVDVKKAAERDQKALAQKAADEAAARKSAEAVKTAQDAKPVKVTKKTASQPAEPATEAPESIWNATVCKILGHCHFDGRFVRVPKVGAEQFAQVTAAFRSAGAKWDNAARAHAFPSNARILLVKLVKNVDLGPDGTSRPAPLKS